MNGAEKIIEKIEQDSQAKSEALLAEADRQARQLLEDAAAQAGQSTRAAIAAAKEKAAFELSAARARKTQTEKRALLQMKNEVIRDVIAAALERLKALPDKAYFEVLAKLAARYAQPGQGVMRLSQKDLDRLPKEFAPADITIDPRPADIADGFILAYGDIEQNCTFEALAAARLDDIKDALHAHLFAQGG